MPTTRILALKFFSFHLMIELNKMTTVTNQIIFLLCICISKYIDNIQDVLEQKCKKYIVGGLTKIFKVKVAKTKSNELKFIIFSQFFLKNSTMLKHVFKTLLRATCGNTDNVKT